MKEPKTRCQQIERSIIKITARKYGAFVDALNEYKMIEEETTLLSVFPAAKDSMLCWQSVCRRFSAMER